MAPSPGGALSSTSENEEGEENDDDQDDDDDDDDENEEKLDNVEVERFQQDKSAPLPLTALMIPVQHSLLDVAGETQKV